MKSKDVTIRQAKPAEYAKVAEMHYPSWRLSWTGIIAPHHLDLIGQPHRWATQFYPLTLSRDGWAMWVAEYRNRLLGMIMFGPDVAVPRDLHIDALYVTEHSQRHGIGGRLLNKALRANPSEDVILWCADKNQKARSFYEKKDFHEDGRTFTWQPLPGVDVPHVGYRLKRR